MIKLDITRELDAADGKMMLSVAVDLEPSKLIAIYGESGAGKTSLLRMIAGLMQPDSGSIEVNNSIWFDSSKKINAKPQQRSIGYVFQNYALFPNLTVRKNLEYALQRGQGKDVVDDLVELMELGNLHNRKPATLSGGQQQRVALARALVQKPTLLLLDEPLSALDDEMRHRLQDYILKVHSEYQLTTLLVSHDLSEVYKMADEVLVLSGGQVSNFGIPETVFSKHQVSGKYRFTGTVIDLRSSDQVVIVNVLVANNLIKVIATEEEAEKLNKGDKVMVVSKAFNPLIMKLAD